jgi:phosphoribosylformylglycinamidine cyclo-ligase
VLPLFDLLRELGNVSDSEMYRTFNMGVGMVIVTARENVAAIANHLHGLKNPCFEIGEVVAGDGAVSIE